MERVKNLRRKWREFLIEGEMERVLNWRRRRREFWIEAEYGVS